MILSLVDRRRDPSPPGLEALAAPWTVLAQLAGALGREDWRLDLVLVDDHDMTALNRGYRGVAEPTDVLSFSYLASGDAEAGGVPAAVASGLRAGERGACRELRLDAAEAGDGSSALAGEVVLAPAFIAGRCRERGWAVDHEMALLVVHGCLHILGWEHDHAADRRAMMELETAVLRGCGLPHPLAEGT